MRETIDGEVYREIYREMSREDVRMRKGDRRLFNSFVFLLTPRFTFSTVTEKGNSVSETTTVMCMYIQYNKRLVVFAWVPSHAGSNPWLRTSPLPIAKLAFPNPKG